MADLKISQLTSATLPLAGTEVLPIVQSSSTKKVATDDLTVKNVRSNATTGILQIAGPAAAATRTMTVPDANFTAARTDAAQSFTGDQTLGTGNLIQGTAAKGVNFTANTPAAGMTSQLLNWYEEITAASTACTGAITTAASWTLTRVGNVITLTLPPITGAATSSAYFEFGVVVPSGYRPASSLLFPCGVRDNDANQSTAGMCIVTSAGNIRIYPNIAASANFTANVSATAAGFAQGCGFSCSWRL